MCSDLSILDNFEYSAVYQTSVTVHKMQNRLPGNFLCSADHEQDWQPYPVDPYSCYMCDHTYKRSAVFRISDVQCVCIVITYTVVDQQGKV